MLQRRVRGAVPAVAWGEREEGGQAPEDRPLMEGDRRSRYAAHQLSHSPGAPASAPLLLLSFRNLWCLPGPDMNKRKLVLINAALRCSALLEQPPWPVLAAADTYGTVHF